MINKPGGVFQKSEFLSCIFYQPTDKLATFMPLHEQSKKPFYFEEYLNYREHLKGFVLAPKMQTTLDAYFSEKVINECEK